MELFFFEDMVVFFFAAVMCSDPLAPFVALISELLAVVVVAVSVLVAQEVKNATPIRTVMEERMDLFIGCWLTSTDCGAAGADRKQN